MTKKEKLIARFLKLPSDFHYNEMVILLGYFGYVEEKHGKTAGSRVRFVHKEKFSIILHKPHPNGMMKIYQLKQVKEVLDL